MIPPALGLLASFIPSLIVVTIAIYVASKILAEEEHIGYAFATALVGVLIDHLLRRVFSILGILLAVVAWLYLIKKFYRTGWLKAFAIAFLALIIEVVIWGALAIAGLLAFL